MLLYPAVKITVKYSTVVEIHQLTLEVKEEAYSNSASKRSVLYCTREQSQDMLKASSICRAYRVIQSSWLQLEESESIKLVSFVKSVDRILWRSKNEQSMTF